MTDDLTAADIESFQEDGYIILRGLIPVALLTELRALAEEARHIARTTVSPQAQRLQPVEKFLPIDAYDRLRVLPRLRAAVRQLYSDEHSVGGGPGEGTRMGILLEPAERAHCTVWHRDWRDNMPGLDIHVWRELRDDLRFFNQINCPLYDDGCTWVVPGSHRRDDTPAERDRFPIRPIPRPNTEGMSLEEGEYACREYAQSMPGAVQVHLYAGDFMIYRNTLWHMGNYLPSARRATIHDCLYHPAHAGWFWDWPRRPDGKREMMNPHTD